MSTDKSVAPSMQASESCLRKVKADLYRSYEIHFVEDLIGSQISSLAQRLESRKSLLVTTPTVACLYGEKLLEGLQSIGLDVSMLVLPLREESKSLEQVAKICETAQNISFDRKSILVGMGGGVCTDIVTMAASWIRRGIDYIRIPTTLLGQVDGSIGVKGAVNFGRKKNSLGCYYSPTDVFVDPGFLRTLPPRHLSLGLSEIIKMGLVRDSRLFELVEQHGTSLLRSRFSSPREEAHEVLQRAILGMIDELETNMYEDQTYRRLVDFGHTFSPLLEAASGFTLPHGDAVAIDMALSCEISCEFGMLDRKSCDRVIDLLRDCDLPIDSQFLTVEGASTALDEAAMHRGGAPNLVLPTRIGSATFVERRGDLPDSILRKTLKRLKQRTNIDVLNNQSTETCLVFDVGGTSMRAAIYEADTKNLINSITQPTPNNHRNPGVSPEDICRLVIEQMDNLAETLFVNHPPSTVSVAFSGPLNERREVTAAPTIWGPSNGQPIDLLDYLHCLWPAPRIFLLNDVTAAGYRFLKHSKESLCVVTVGSGIGNKIFVEGKPYTGPSGRGGEMGHIQVDSSEDAIICDCGGRGHLGAVASGRGTLATALQRAERDPSRFSQSKLKQIISGDSQEMNNSHIVEAFHAGDPWTHEVIRHVALKLGRALATVHLTIGIERFVVFGGFAMALGDQYRQYLAEAAAQSTWESGQDWNAMIELGIDDDNSGLIGAGRFAMEFCGNQ